MSDERNTCVLTWKTRNVYEIYIEHCLPYHIINIRIEKGENKIWLNQFWLMPCIYSSWVESISDKCVCNYFVYTTSSISKGAKTFMISNSKNIPSLKNYLKWFTFFARKLNSFMVSSELAITTITNFLIYGGFVKRGKILFLCRYMENKIA